jgi:hypothetical protein
MLPAKYTPEAAHGKDGMTDLIPFVMHARKWFSVSILQSCLCDQVRIRLPVAGTVVLSLIIMGIGHGGVRAEQRGFAKACTGFARDPVLGAIWSDQTKPQSHSPSLAAEVPRLALQGSALATQAPSADATTTPSLEFIFGVSPHGPRAIVETSFYQESRAVVLSSRLLATVAHALTPDSVEIHVGSRGMVSTVPLRVTRKTIKAYGADGEEGLPTHLVHTNEPYDLALVQTLTHTALRPLPYPAVLSYGTGDPAKPSGGLNAGACVAAIVPVRDAQNRDTGAHQLAVGKVLAKAPVAVNHMTQTKLNVNMFTTDVDVQPGDSGSPVLALQGGEPVLVGLVAATMYPAATFTYVNRIDPLLAFVHALRHTPLQGAKLNSPE